MNFQRQKGNVNIISIVLNLLLSKYLTLLSLAERMFLYLMGSEKSMVIIRDCLFDCADQIPQLYMVIWECHAMTASFH